MEKYKYGICIATVKRCVKVHMQRFHYGIGAIIAYKINNVAAVLLALICTYK